MTTTPTPTAEMVNGASAATVVTTDNHPLPEAPASATVKVRSPNGFTYLLTRRARTMSGLLRDLETLEDILIKKGWESAEHAPAATPDATSAAAPATPMPFGIAPASPGLAPMCSHHGPMQKSKHKGWYCTHKHEGTPKGYCTAEWKE